MCIRDRSNAPWSRIVCLSLWVSCYNCRYSERGKHDRPLPVPCISLWYAWERPKDGCSIRCWSCLLYTSFFWESTTVFNPKALALLLIASDMICSIVSLEESGANRPIPVSYTHLDVYKRQGTSLVVSVWLPASEVASSRFPVLMNSNVSAVCLLYTSRCV